MKTRMSATVHRRSESSWLGAGTAIGFALLPLGVMLWAVPQTGLGFA
ncbi:MAG: hypothetical protein V4574_06525 [Pseudomonadota bacterium]